MSMGSKTNFLTYQSLILTSLHQKNQKPILMNQRILMMMTMRNSYVDYSCFTSSCCDRIYTFLFAERTRF